MSEQEWSESFAKEIRELGVVATHGEMLNLARRLWPLLGSLQPNAAARGDFELRRGGRQLRAVALTDPVSAPDPRCLDDLIVYGRASVPHSSLYRASAEMASAYGEHLSFGLHRDPRIGLKEVKNRLFARSAMTVLQY